MPRARNTGKRLIKRSRTRREKCEKCGQLIKKRTLKESKK